MICGECEQACVMQYPRGMATSKSYRGLEAWQASIAAVERIYAATRRFPDEERFGLTSQLRRACVSMPANIAEGKGRRSTEHCSATSESRSDHMPKLKPASKLRGGSNISR